MDVKIFGVKKWPKITLGGKKIESRAPFFAVNQKGKTPCKRDYIKQVKSICFVVAQLEEARFEEERSV